MKTAIMGPPGAGKTTIVKALVEKYSMISFSSGDFARKLTVENELVKKALSVGALPPLGKELDKEVDYFLKSNGGVILDGYPRTLAQAKWVHRKLDLLIILRCPDDVCLERMTERVRENEDEISISNRLKAFHDLTAPAIGFLVSTNLRTITFNTDGLLKDDMCSKVVAIMGQFK